MSTLLCHVFLLGVVAISAKELVNMDMIIDHILSAVNKSDTVYDTVSPQCLEDTVQFAVEHESASYARQMYHSSGALPADGEFTYNIKDFGNFDLCRDIKPEYGVHSFGGLYCLSKTDIKPLSESTADIGVCFPDSCTDRDIPLFVSQGFKDLLDKVPISYVMCAREYHIRPGDVPAIFICVVLVAVIIAGTVYDALKRRKQRQTLEMNTSEQATCTPENQSTNADDAVISPSNAELNIESREMPKKCASKCKEFVQGCLLSFSLCVNICKMMGTVHGKSSITCLNGIRVLSMFWIILFHSYLFVGQYYPTVGNFRYATEVDQGRTVVLWKGDLAVEAFLVLSGLLVSYLTLNQLHRRGGPRHLNWLLFYFHRYWRLTPVYIFVMMLYATLVIYVSDGPLWWQWYYVQAECAATIWEHILYLNNFIPFPGDVGGCFGWSWYLAVDMQLYWMSPIFIIVFYKSRNGGICLTALTTCFCIALSAYFATVQGMPFGVDRVKYRYPKHEEGAWLYTKPWYRLPNYLVGIVLGYILFKLNGKKVQINKYLNIFIWCCAFAVALSIVYGVLTSVAGIRISQGAAVLYITIHRLVFSVCVGWVVFACATGNGGPVNTILSWRIWLPLARMNYCAYLVHLVVIFIYTFSMKSLYYYSDLGFTLDFIGILVVTYSVSFVIAIAVELPMLELEKVIIPAKYRKVQPSKN